MLGRQRTPIESPPCCAWTAPIPASQGTRSPITSRTFPLGFSLMFVAGVLSGLLGIGSGAVKVLAMDQAMKLPFKVSTTTSNFMIGVTAAASAGVYLNRGYIDPGLAMPVMLGVLVGSLLGARVLGWRRSKNAPHRLQRRHRRPGGGDDVQGLRGKNVSTTSPNPNAAARANQPPEARQAADLQMDRIMAILLRSGVLIAAALVLIGGIIFLARHSQLADHRTFQSEPSELRTIPGIAQLAREGHGRGLINSASCYSSPLPSRASSSPSSPSPAKKTGPTSPSPSSCSPF